MNSLLRRSQIVLMLSSVRLAAPFSTINSAVHNVYIAIGSNVEDRALALHDAFTKLQTVGTIKSTSFLYESLPMYHTEQPKFLNAAVHLETALPPDSLLVHLKSIETELGRKTTFRNGPRVVDLDILFYDDQQIQTDSLEIPHPRIAERSFVLKPLYDIQPNLLHPATGLTVKQMLDKLPKSSITEEMVKVIPCVLYQSNEDRSNSSIEREQQQISTSLLYLNKTTPCIFGVLNVTPDSFSDGGKYNSVQKAVEEAKSMVLAGATVIDIGGESTRPGAVDVNCHEELDRVIPVIRAIREAKLPCLISIDTRKAIVADQAVKAGANIVNDVSGGKYDKDMISTVVSLKSPFVMMHMRGNPDTMTTKAHTQYQDVVCEVAQELQQQLKVVNSCIPKWLQIVDPGIGFAKGYDENMQILKPENLKKLKKMLEYRPLFIGLSRKRFLSRIIDEAKIKRKGLSRLGSEQDWFCSDMTVEDRDFATAGACAAALIGGADILRVHNIKLVTTVCDSLISVLGCNEEYD